MNCLENKQVLLLSSPGTTGQAVKKQEASSPVHLRTPVPSMEAVLSMCQPNGSFGQAGSKQDVTVRVILPTCQRLQEH